MSASARTGPTGPAGEGVPVGGTDGQVLAKASATDFDTEWVDQTGGTGGGGAPSGPAGGVLSGTYPDPGFAVDMATQAELDAEASTRASADTALDTRVDALEASTTAADLAAHEADTTGVHGITDTSALVLTDDARLSDTRTPTDGSVTAAKVAGSLKPSGTAAAGTEALRALGTSASTAAAGNDSRLSDSRTPTAHASTHAAAGSDPVTLAQSQVSSLTSDLAAKAALASPTFTGTPAAPTATQGTNTPQLATTAYVQTEAGLLVPKSLVDAKGDLLVGTADNTVGRLAAGTDGHVLTADSTVTAGVKWAAATGGSSPTYVTSLPGSPTDGQEVFYAADATNGVIWHLRYRSAVTKWEFLGGPPLLARVNTSESKSTTTGYTDLTTVGPTVTAPLAGDYDVEFGVFVASSASVANIANTSYTVGATAPSDTDAVTAGWSTSASTQGSTGQRRNRVTGLSASTALKVQYKLAAAGTTSFANRWIALTPVRVS